MLPFWLCINCWHCRHFVAPPHYQWTDLAKCTHHGTFAELARKNETLCGMEAHSFVPQ